jgi:hypothetical protein
LRFSAVRCREVNISRAVSSRPPGAFHGSVTGTGGKAAEKRLLFEARGVRDGAAGFTRAGLAEAQGRVNDLAAALEAACVDDPVLAAQVRRSVA